MHRDRPRVANKFAAVLFMIWALLLVQTVAAQTQKKSAPEYKAKIRAITAFVNLDRTQYQVQISEAVKMLKRARTIFESRGFEVESVEQVLGGGP